MTNEYRYRKYIRRGQYILPFFLGFLNLIALGLFGFFYKSVHSPALIPLGILLLFIPMESIAVWYLYYRMSGVCISLADDGIVYKYRGGEKLLPYDNLRLEFSALPYMGGWIKITSDKDTLRLTSKDTVRITVALENISGFVQELKAAMDQRELSDRYDRAKFFSFMKTAVYADQSFERIAAFFGRLSWVPLVFGLIILSAALGYGFGALEEIQGFYGVGFFGMSIWMLVIVLWPLVGFVITELFFIRQIAKDSDSQNFTSPSRNLIHEQTLYGKTALIGIWILFSYALPLVIALFIADVTLPNLSNNTQSTSVPVPKVILVPPSPAAFDNLRELPNIEVPIYDPVDVAQRLKGIKNIPRVIAKTAPTLSMGATRSFWVLNTSATNNAKIQAELRYVTPHVYFWVAQGVQAKDSDIRALVDDFEANTYPTERAYFGKEWTPGIDGDPHLNLFYTSNMGNDTYYFLNRDEFSHLVFEHSNETEMIYINASAINLGDKYTKADLASLFPYLIMWRHTPNESWFVRNAFSDLGVLISGHPLGNANGVSRLFIYFRDRFGDEITRALIANPHHYLNAMDDVLRSNHITDPATGNPITANDVYADWAVTNFLNDPNIADGRYAYKNFQPSTVDAEKIITQCPLENQTYTTDIQTVIYYLEIKCTGNLTLNFTGSQQVRVKPADAHSGEYMLWSNEGDYSDMLATHVFDFSHASEPLSLDYWIWYSAANNGDYLYVEASSDGGKTWEILRTTYGTDANPRDLNMGWGYTGQSGNGTTSQWINEKIDLNAYAEQPNVLLRFEFVTNSGGNSPGVLLDDLSISAINYREDFENGADGWDMAGWVRMNNMLPQLFQLQVIKRGAVTEIIPFPLNDQQTGSLNLNFNKGKSAILVVAGRTPITREAATFQFSVTPSSSVAP